MECTRCDDGGAERMEIRYRNDVTVVVYLCGECSESLRREDAIEDIVGAPVA